MNATAVRRLGLPEYAVPVTRRPRADAPCAWRGRWRVSRAGLVPGGAHGVPACGRHDERRGRPGPQLGTTRPCLVEFFMWGSIADATPGRSRLPPARPSASALIPDEAWPRRSFVVRGRGLGFHASAVPVPRRPRADAPGDAWRDRSRDERRAGHWECRPAAGTMNAAAPSRRPELTPAADREVRSACGYPLVVTDDPSEAESSRRIDRTIRIGSMHEADPDRDHWLTRSPAERLAALEACREAFYGTDAVRRGLARVLEIARQE
jgi:hypothetical protein